MRKRNLAYQIRRLLKRQPRNAIKRGKWAPPYSRCIALAPATAGPNRAARRAHLQPKPLLCVACGGPLASDLVAADRTGQDLCATCETTVDQMPTVDETTGLPLLDMDACPNG